MDFGKNKNLRENHEFYWGLTFYRGFTWILEKNALPLAGLMSSLLKLLLKKMLREDHEVY